MSEIPEDVKTTARKLCAEYEINNPHGFEEQIIARAIMAERSRCVEVVESWRKRMFGGRRLYIFADEVVQAIRRGN